MATASIPLLVGNTQAHPICLVPRNLITKHMWQLHSHTCCRESCSAQRVGLSGLLWEQGKHPLSTKQRPQKVGEEEHRWELASHLPGSQSVSMVKDCPLYTSTRGICLFNMEQGRTLHRESYFLREQAGSLLHSGPFFPRPGFQDREASRHQD